jgi:protein-tyrosine phosphatase
MKTEVYWIMGPWPGRLAIAPRPRGGDWLKDEVRAWRDTGLDVVVSFLTPDEMTELDLNQEEQWCHQYGIEFHSFPIPDRGVPGSREAVINLIRSLEQALAAGKSVAVHCRQGIGRSGMIVAALLISAGEEPETVWEHIHRARRRPVPDTDEQRDWVQTFGIGLVDAMRRGG